MKKNLLLLPLLLCLVACEQSGPQLKDYRPMIVEGYQWNILRRAVFTGNNFNRPYYTTVEFLAGDTLINSQTYHKLMESSNEDKSNPVLKALLREDVEQQRIYCYAHNQEWLLYDFGMPVGKKTNLYINSSYRDEDCYVVLGKVVEAYDNNSQLYRKFRYDVYVSYDYDGRYILESSYWVSERFGTKEGIADNTYMLDGAGYRALLCAYDEQGILVLSSDDEDMPYAGDCFVAE